jgi:hypothetical protein
MIQGHRYLDPPILGVQRRRVKCQHPTSHPPHTSNSVQNCASSPTTTLSLDQLVKDDITVDDDNWVAQVSTVMDILYSHNFPRTQYFHFYVRPVPTNSSGPQSNFTLGAGRRRGNSREEFSVVKASSKSREELSELWLCEREEPFGSPSEESAKALGLCERKSSSPPNMCAGDSTFKFRRRRTEYQWKQLYHDTRILSLPHHRNSGVVVKWEHACVNVSW